MGHVDTVASTTSPVSPMAFVAASHQRAPPRQDAEFEMVRANAWIVLLPCFATKRGAHVNSFLCAKTQDLGVQAFAVMKSCRDTVVKTRGSSCASGCPNSGS